MSHSPAAPQDRIDDSIASQFVAARRSGQSLENYPGPLPLDLDELLADAESGFAADILTQPVRVPLADFLFDRLRGLLKDAGHAPDAIEAVPLTSAPRGRMREKS